MLGYLPRAHRRHRKVTLTAQAFDIHINRIDDVPLLLELLKKMEMTEVLDASLKSCGEGHVAIYFKL